MSGQRRKRSMPLEVERKYLHVDFAALRRTLYDLGARTSGAHFESNWVFDTPDIQLLSLIHI